MSSYHKLPDIKTIYNRLKSSAKRRNIPFDLTLNSLNNITFPITCPILNIKLEFNRGSVQDNSYSFDRINNNLGYTIDNIVIISYKANVLRGSLNIEHLDNLKSYLISNQ